MSLAYYRTERLQYPEAKRINVTREVIDFVVPKIFNSLGYTEVRVEINPRAKNWSWYRPGAGFMTPRHGLMSHREDKIEIATSMLNWLTVAHEVAHALHCQDYDRRFRAAQKVKFPDERWVVLTRDRHLVLPKELWHGKEHRQWVAKVIGFLKSIDAIREPVVRQDAPADLYSQKQWISNVIRTLESDGVDGLEGSASDYNNLMKAEALAALPPKMLCPHCLQERTREEFGVRIVKKTPQGRALKVIRQSYCADCR